MTFELDRLVCECPSPDDAPGYRWYEADLDDPRQVAALTTGTALAAPSGDQSPRLLGSTRHRHPASLARLLDQVLAGGRQPTHVQVECPPGGLPQTLEVIRARGLQPVPAWHRTASPRSAADLLSLVSAMSEHGTDVIKLVYPADRAEVVQWTVDLLLDPPAGLPSLSLTPTGDRQARVAAALAGSCLVFAPLHTTRERMAAAWYRELAVSTTTRDEGVQSWQLIAAPS